MIMHGLIDAYSSVEHRAAASRRARGAPIRVLHVIKNLGLGGAETNLLSLASAFDPATIETHVAYSGGGRFEPRFRASVARFFAYADRDHRVRSWQSVGIVWRLVRYIRRHRIDIVHTHNLSGHIWGVLAAKLAGAKVVEHVHDFRYTPPDELVRRHGWIDQYRFVRYFRGRSDRVVVLTDAHRRFVVEHGYARDDAVAKIPNGIVFEQDTGACGSRVNRSPSARERVVVLTAARMHASKNIDLVLRIAARVRCIAPAVLFVVAGDGEQLEAYRARRDALQVADCVDFVGFRPDVDTLLDVSDIYLSPSWLELHSIAILEALRKRVPVVASSGVGCNDEFIEDGVNGFLCDPASDAPWVEVLGRLCVDSGLRHVVGDRGYETARRLFDLRTIAERLTSLYADLADAPS